MATGNKLEVQIGADTSDLKKGLNEAVIALEKLRQQKSVNLKAGLDVSALNAQINAAKASLASLQKQNSSTTKSFETLGKGTANGSNALMQFSRIAQDAPYGIMGIGNNLTATAEAFSYLQKQTGSTGGALKSLASSLMGSGGILLGISLLTTGLTLLASSGLSISDILDKLTGNFDEFGNAVKKASEEGAKSISQEVISIKALVSVAQDDTKSKRDRLIAVDELQKRYPLYFGNLTKEKILTGDVTNETINLTKALLSRAIAEKLSSDSASIQLEIFKQYAKLNNAKNKTAQEELKLETDLSAAKKINGISESQLAIIRAKGINSINAAKEAEKDARAEIIKGTNALKQRQDIINKFTADQIPLSGNLPAKVKTPKVKKPKFEFQQGFIPGGIVAPSINFDSTLLQMDIIPDKVNEKLAMVQNALLDFNTRAGEIINSSISDTFSGLGSAIGGALATGGNVLKAAGNSLLAGLGGILTSLGTMAIEIGVGMLGIKAALKTLNPFAAIAAGVALVALGSIFSSKATSLGGSMGGSSGSTSTSTGAGANTRTTSSSGGSSFSNGGTVVFEISGQSLIGVLSNTLDKNKRLGGSLAL